MVLSEKNLIGHELHIADYADCIDFFLGSCYSYPERLRLNDAGRDGVMHVPGWLDAGPNVLLHGLRSSDADQQMIC